MKFASGLLLIATLNAAPQFTQGLQRIDRNGQAVGDCPLKRTAVDAGISGMLARVTVTQEFRNSYSETIEAIYAFPLPHDASVDRMTVTTGGRTIRGVIKRREDARALYDAARQSGQTAALLDQERPNIFTQSVTNIPPGGTVQVSISYVELVDYENGDYQFVFPMVVGPRYIPGSGIRLHDAHKITPPLAAERTRPGHDVTLSISLDAGMPLGALESPTHKVDIHRTGSNGAQIRLRDEGVIPDKDFVLRYDGAGRSISSAILAHRASKGGFFALILQPPERALAADVAPKELIFVLDTSGSMMGFPIEKAKETMKLALGNLRPRDTFNLVTFAGDTEILFPSPVPATSENLQIATLFLQSRTGSGGTEMMKAVRAALAGSGEPDRVRIVCFMTDGYVGNDLEIIAQE